MTETIWLDPSIPPAIPKGVARSYIVAVRRSHSGKVWTMPAQYISAFPLQYNDGCCGKHDDACPEDGSHEDGCPTTGWFSERASFEYDGLYEALLGKDDVLVAWSEIQMHPLDSRLTAKGDNHGL